MVRICSDILSGVARLANGKKGQFILPAVLLVPIVLLVIYLIYETAKLSRAKIRQQVALDAAAFVELQPAATYLNASAYVNAAFPYRVFRDNMNTPIIPDKDRGKGKQPLTVYDWFYKAGAFPGSADANAKENWNPKDTDLEWNIRYAEGSRPGWEVEDPKSPGDKEVILTDKDIADQYMVDETLMLESTWFYVTVYNLLGDIFAKQGDIYKKISKGGMFFRKSYDLNMAGGCSADECGKEGSRAFSNTEIKLKPFNIRKMKLYYTDVYMTGSKRYHYGFRDPVPVIEVSQLSSSPDLFQFSYLDSNSKNTLRKLKRGITVVQPFTPPSNYFNADLKKYNPRVRAHVNLSCPSKDNNCIWPKATSKYQVRLTP